MLRYRLTVKLARFFGNKHLDIGFVAVLTYEEGYQKIEVVVREGFDPSSNDLGFFKSKFRKKFLRATQEYEITVFISFDTVLYCQVQPVQSFLEPTIY